MDDLAQRVQLLQFRLYQEAKVKDLLATLDEIETLVSEHPAENTYDLLARVYNALCDATRDEPDLTLNQMLQRLLRWLIVSDLPDSADYARSEGREILTKWLDQYPEDMRLGLLQPILDELATALHTSPTTDLCWTISSLGYRRPNIVAGLWEVVRQNDNKLGDVALRALQQLGVQESERSSMLKELHHRIRLRMSNPLLGALHELGDISTIPVIFQCLHQWSTNEEISLTRMLAVGVLSNIADSHDTDALVQKKVWETIVELYESAPDRYATEIQLNSQITSHCNEPGVPSYLVLWLEHYPDDTENAIHRRYLLYLRLSECVRPRQLVGLRQPYSSKAIALIQQDASRNSKNTSRWETLESKAKQQAWEILLYLGNVAVLSIARFNKAISQETSGYLRGEIMELLACFHWRSLPKQTITWITERVDVKQDEASQELPTRLGAVRLARSAATRQAFDALLSFGLTVQGEALRETADALASVSLALAQNEEPGIVETLLAMIEGGKEGRHRTAAMQALAWIAGNDLLPQQHLSRILATLNDEKREDFERSRLVHILGLMPRGDITPDILSTLQNQARSDHSRTATSALEALAQTGELLEMPDMLEKLLHLRQVGEKWDYQPATPPSYWTVSMIVTLYRYDLQHLAPAVATLLKNASIFELTHLLRMLNEVHGSEHHLLPEEVQTALLSRLNQMQDEGYTTPTELLQTGVRLLPDAFVDQPWEQQWEAWTPETRAALAEALSQRVYTSEHTREQASRLLLLLIRDAQYKVRRAAYRSLAVLAPGILFLAGVSWAYSPIMDLRRRAAEALNWLSAEKAFRQSASGVIKELAIDPDPLVRETVVYARHERRQRDWANEYLGQVRRTYTKSNKVRLAAWRYAHALTMTGDDSIITELQADLTTRKLAPHERQWLLWIVNNTKEQWKKTVDKWPKPWFTWTGQIWYGQGQVAVDTDSLLTGTFCLYQQGTANDSSQADRWGGVFLPDIPTVASEQKMLKLILTDGRLGQVSIMKRLRDGSWLLEGVGSLSQP